MQIPYSRAKHCSANVACPPCTMMVPGSNQGPVKSFVTALNDDNAALRISPDLITEPFEQHFERVVIRINGIRLVLDTVTVLVDCTCDDPVVQVAHQAIQTCVKG